MCVRSSMIQRAKSEKFEDGYLIFFGQLVQDYIVSAMKRVFLRYCILNIKVKQKQARKPREIEVTTMATIKVFKADRSSTAVEIPPLKLRLRSVMELLRGLLSQVVLQQVSTRLWS